MDAMVRDMRNRFLVAAVLSIPIMLFSPMARDMLGFAVPAPFGLRDDVFGFPAEPAGGVLLGVDLLRRRLAGAAGPNRT